MSVNALDCSQTTLAAFDRVARAIAMHRMLPVALLLFAAVPSLYFGQDANWDLRSYHFYNVFAWLHDRLLIDLAPAGFQTYLNPVLDLPFYGLVSLHLPPKVIAVLMAVPYAVAAFVTAKLAWLILPPMAPPVAGCIWAMACLIGLSGAAAVPLIGSTMNDVTVGALTLIAVYVAVAGNRSGTTGFRGAMLAAGFAMGIAAGSKLTAAPFAIALFASVTLTQPSIRSAFGAAGRLIAGGVLGFALAAAPWTILLYRKFDSPVFPFFNGIFRSPFWEQWNLLDERFVSRSSADILLLPFKLVTTKQGFVVEPPLRDWRFAAVMSSAALALLVLSWRRAARISAPSGTTVALSRLQNIQRARVFIFVAIGYALWVKVFTYYRYVVPLEMCSGIVTMACICAVFRGSRARVFVGLAITAIVLATTTYPRWGRAPFATKAIDVSIPRIAPRSLVLFTDHQPAGYLIPFFPSDARFIAPWWTLGDPRFVDFTNPRYTNLLQQRINDTIAGHDGPLYAVGLDRRIGGPSSNNLRGTKEAILREYGLIEEPNSCEQIKSNLDNSALDICRLQRDRGGHQTAVQ